MHKKDRDVTLFKRSVCSSPIYVSGRDTEIAERTAPYNWEGVDEGRESKNEGIYPGLGSWHFQHRIDGKLVAMGVNDFTNTVMNAQYFIYDPDYSFLCLGVIGAIHEIEYMRMVRKKFNENLQWYQLGEMVLNCPKVNYKMSYKPGTLLCPRTHELVPYEEVKGKVKHYSRLPMEFKK